MSNFEASSTRALGLSEFESLMARSRDELRSRRARVTDARVQILAHLMATPYAISHADVQTRLEAAGSSDIDRVTVYRVLDWLVAENLAHKVAMNDRVYRFAAGGADSVHGHFKCDTCEHIYCVSQERDITPELKENLPSGFVVRGFDLTLHGTCASCATKSFDASKH